MKAFYYGRVSGRGQIDGDGFVRQREAVSRYALAHSIEVVAEFRDEGVSGTKELADRDGLRALFEQLDTDSVRLVLCERADRIARDLIVGEIILGQFRDRGVTVIECEGGQDLTVADGDPTRKLLRQLLGAIAEFDKACICQKLRAARDRIRRKHGRCEGPKPFGSKPGEAQVVARIKSLREQKLTFAAIVNALNSEGIPTRTGARWSITLVKRVADRT